MVSIVSNNSQLYRQLQSLQVVQCTLRCHHLPKEIVCVFINLGIRNFNNHHCWLKLQRGSLQVDRFLEVRVGSTKIFLMDGHDEECISSRWLLHNSTPSLLGRSTQTYSNLYKERRVSR